MTQTMSIPPWLCLKGRCQKQMTRPQSANFYDFFMLSFWIQNNAWNWKNSTKIPVRPGQTSDLFVTAPWTLKSKIPAGSTMV